MSHPNPAPSFSVLAALRQHYRQDALAGLGVMLLGLPLSLAVARASGFPPVAGLLTAIVGGLVVTFVGGTALTIKGPAAGLVGVAAGAVAELGHGHALLGYRLTLAALVVAGVVQILFGVLRAGVLRDFLPSAAVRGMLAAVGIALIIKELFGLLGVQPAATTTLGLVAELPHAVATLNPDVFCIGALSLGLLGGLPLLRPRARPVPGPLLALAVLLVAVALGRYFDLEHAHSYRFINHRHYQLGPALLLPLPGRLGAGLTFPDFSQVFSAVSIKYVGLFALVGSLESLLGGKAVELLDPAAGPPAARNASANRDLLGIGIGNTLAALLGGLPMTAEVVRSSASVRSGARTRWANFFQGLWLLLGVVLAGPLLARIPLAALAALLICAGGRLASPAVFREMFRAGGERLALFLITLGVSLATNVLLGIGVALAAKLAGHLLRGMPLRSAFRSTVEVDSPAGDNFHRLTVRDAAVFSNYISLQNRLDALPTGQHVVIDLSQTKLVDHTVLENLNRFRNEYTATGGLVEMIGPGALRTAAT